MSTVLLWLAILGGLALGAAVIRVMARHGQSSNQASPNESGSDLHGSNSNFGNSLKGDNSSFGRCFYDE